MSVKAEPGEKAVIVFGQDDVIFNQNSSNTLQWVGPNGERPLMPKNSGMGRCFLPFNLGRQAGARFVRGANI